MKKGDKVLVSPQVTGKKEWTTATVVQVEKNPFAGLVVTAKTKLGRSFF